MVLMLEIVLTILHRNAIYVKLLGTRELCPGCVDLRHGSFACQSSGRENQLILNRFGRDFGIITAIITDIASVASVAAVSGIALLQSVVKASTVDKLSEQLLTIGNSKFKSTVSSFTGTA